MKKIFFLASIIVCIAASSQQNNAMPKTITVNGSAQMEIVPDEIYLQVDLKEYEKKGVGKIDIEKIKKDFLTKCKRQLIADSLISVYELEGNNGNYWWMKKNKKKEDLTAGISYWIKLNNAAQIEKIASVLDDEATTNFFIAKATHSKVTEFRKQLKIQAIKAAKEKAVYLSDAINEKVTAAITITEPNEYDSDNRIGSYANVLSNSNMIDNYKLGNPNSPNSMNVDFKKIKLRYEVTVVFGLQ